MQNEDKFPLKLHEKVEGIKELRMLSKNNQNINSYAQLFLQFNFPPKEYLPY